MLTICKTLKFVTKNKSRTPSWISVIYLSILFCVATFLLVPVQTTFGQGILRQRSQENTKQKTKNTESAQNNNDSAAIPWSSLDERSKKLIREVVDSKTFMRRMPQQTGYCDPEMYDFLIEHPDVVIELWELLGVTNLSLRETGLNKYELKEGTASTSQVEVLYKSDNLCIVYALGEYEAPVVRRKIKGDVVLFLKSRYGQDKDDRLVVQSDLDAYVRIHNPGAEMLAKMLVPVVGKIADSNFEQTVGFVANISESAQDDFEPLVELARRMKIVRPVVAQEFALVAETVFDREVDRYIALATAKESQAMPKYALQSNEAVRVQEQTMLSNNLRMQASSAVSSPTVPDVIPNAIDERLVPLTTSEIRRDMPQKHDRTTASLVIDADDPSDDVSLDALMRSLQEPIESPPINATSREKASSREATLPPPRILTIVNDDRMMAPIPGVVESSRSTVPSPNPISSSVPTDNTRVVIRTITPSASSVVSRELSQQQMHQTAPTTPSPTRFGTTTPVIPQQSRTKNSQTNGRPSLITTRPQ